LQVRIQEAQDHDEFWIGAKHSSQQYDDIYIEGEANTGAANIAYLNVTNYTWVNNASESDATHSDGAARHLNATRASSGASDLGTIEQAIFRLDYALSTLPYGTYRCLVAVKASESSGSGNDKNAAEFSFGMGWQYGEVSLLLTTRPAVASFVSMTADGISAGTQSDRELLDLGTLIIPPIATPDNMTDGVFTLNIYCGWNDGSYNAIQANQIVNWFVDYIQLMPIDRGSNYTSKTNDTDYILIDSMSNAKGLYLVDASDVVQSFPSGQLGKSPDAHPNGTRLYIMAQGTTGPTKGDTFTTRVRYRPRFLHVMGA
jgi:hypothetical protein